MKRTPASEILRARGRDVLKARHRVVRRGDPEAIHDVRVATRRLQAALDVLSTRIPDDPRRRLDRRARKMRRYLGARRNVFVLLDLLREFRAGVEDDAHRFVDDLAERLRRSARGRGANSPRLLPGIRKRLETLLRALRGRAAEAAPDFAAAMQGPLQGVLRARATAHG